QGRDDGQHPRQPRPLPAEPGAPLALLALPGFAPATYHPSLRFRVIGSGSSGNTTLVEAAGTRILIDAGLGVRELSERLQSAGVDPTSIALVVLSHEHQDHSKGAASFSRKWGVRLAGAKGTFAACGFAETEIAGWEELEPTSTIDV